MLIGQSVLAPVTPGHPDPGAVYYSPWTPREGDTLTAVVEVIRTSLATAITMACQIETKNNEDSDVSITNLGSPFTVTTAAGDVTKHTESGALEQVRYRLELTGDTLQWVHFRSNPPIWHPN